jgi:hypothetical protein
MSTKLPASPVPGIVIRCGRHAVSVMVPSGAASWPAPASVTGYVRSPLPALFDQCVIAGVVTKYVERLTGTVTVSVRDIRKFTDSASPGWMSVVSTRGARPICQARPSVLRRRLGRPVPLGL